jgi:molecular chaperone GrpE
MTSNEPVKDKLSEENVEAEWVEQPTADVSPEVTVTEEDIITSESTPEEILQHQLEIEIQKSNDNLELAQRTQAEMENLRKRTLRDIENAHKYALDRFVNDLVPVIDSLELGIQASESIENSESIVEGMNLTLKMFTTTLEKHGVVVLEPQGEKFTPDKHNAVSMAESSEFESGLVMSVLQKGYELNGRIVRPAMVVVSK